LSLDVYRTKHGIDRLAYPVPVRDFIAYGKWLHEQLTIPAEPSPVVRLDRAPAGYQLLLENGDTLVAPRVVVAGGIQPFSYRPEMFRNLPAALVTHTSEQRDFARFKNKQVLVIGAGQSALEAAGFMRAA